MYSTTILVVIVVACACAAAFPLSDKVRGEIDLTDKTDGVTVKTDEVTVKTDEVTVKTGVDSSAVVGFVSSKAEQLAAMEDGIVHRSRVKRFITRSGVCPRDHIMTPMGCITCEEYKDLTDEDC